MTISLMQAVLDEPTLRGEERLFMMGVADCNGEVYLRSAAKWCNLSINEAEVIFDRLLAAGWFALVDGLYVQPQMVSIHASEQTCSGHRENKHSLSAKTRRRIIERDGQKCHYCGGTESLTIDHKHPRSKGGADTDDNLVVACKRCNCSKGTKTYEQFISFIGAK